MLNQVQIIGRLGNAPESRTTTSGQAVSNFSVATTEKWKDKQSGEQRENTEWHRCTAFGRVAEIINQYVEKGHLIFVQGKLKTRKWQDKEGKDRYTTEIEVRDVKLLPNAKSGGESVREPASEVMDDDIPF